MLSSNVTSSLNGSSSPRLATDGSVSSRASRFTPEQQAAFQRILDNGPSRPESRAELRQIARAGARGLDNAKTMAEQAKSSAQQTHSQKRANSLDSRVQEVVGRDLDSQIHDTVLHSERRRQERQQRLQAIPAYTQRVRKRASTADKPVPSAPPAYTSDRVSISKQEYTRCQELLLREQQEQERWAQKHAENERLRLEYNAMQDRLDACMQENMTLRQRRSFPDHVTDYETLFRDARRTAPYRRPSYFGWSDASEAAPAIRQGMMDIHRGSGNEEEEAEVARSWFREYALDNMDHPIPPIRLWPDFVRRIYTLTSDGRIVRREEQVNTPSYYDFWNLAYNAIYDPWS